MNSIGGNIKATIQKKTSTKNEYGEGELSWKDVCTLEGYIDLASGSATYTNYNSKITESTHVFMCDYQDIGVSEEESRAIINNKVYDITYIDNPMELNYHLEIFLKYIGGVQVGN